MTKIFISYRHEDSIYVCDGIYKALAKEFGKENIFRDKSSIYAGDNWKRRIEQQVNNCDILLAVMGRRWLTSSDEFGRRRIDHPQDWVVYEIKVALSREIKVIPVLIEDIHMPTSAALPPDLNDPTGNGLTDQEAIELRYGDDYERDMEKLILTIKNWYPPNTIGMSMETRFNIQETAIWHDTISVTKLPPDATQSIPLTLEKNDELLAKINRLLKSYPDISRIAGSDLIQGTDIPNFDPHDFQITLRQEQDNGKQVLTVSLRDTQSRISVDLPDWKLNLLRFSRQNGPIVDIFHNGDNSLPTPYREGSYKRNAPYSIVKFAVQQFPELRSSDPNLVYLGSLPSNSKDLTRDEFAGVRRRLAIYRFARWLWLWDHPRRPR